ncbi:MAG: hypothetical protein JOY71_14285 [Acetobacteraceae bacterium]|nr:hypothetical protein [Acetobacteraceae bacterium]
MQDSPHAITHLELRGARIVNTLDLSGTTLKLICLFRSCEFDSISLVDTRVIGFELDDCKCGTLNARRITVSGYLGIKNGTVEKICLAGANVYGNVDLNGEIGKEPPGLTTVAIDADGIQCYGTVNLSSIIARGEVRLNGCTIGRDLKCHGATLTNPGGWTLNASGATIRGSVYLGETDEARGDREYSVSSYYGTVRLEGAEISGDLSAQNAEFFAYPFISTITQESKPGGILRQSDVFEGYLEAIRGAGVKIGRNIRFIGLRARGTVWLADAEVGGNFDCTGAWFSFPGEVTLWADGIKVTGSTYFSTFRPGQEPVAGTNGVLHLVHARFMRGLTIANFELRRDDNYLGLRTDPPMLLPQPSLAGQKQNLCGIYAPGSQIGGRFLWHQVLVSEQPGSDSGRQLMLFLANARADVLDYAPGCTLWEEEGILFLNKFEYREIHDLGPLEADKWLERLDRQHAFANQKNRFMAVWHGFTILVLSLWRPLRSRLSVKEPSTVTTYERDAKAFLPEPYLQLANVVRQAGYDSAADNILIRLERNRTRYGNQGTMRQIAQWVSDAAIKRGFSPFRPVILLCALWLLSSFAFQAAYQAGEIVPTKDNTLENNLVLFAAAEPSFFKPTATGDLLRGKPAHLISFHQCVYSFELLVPFITLDQRRNWVFRNPEEIQLQRGFLEQSSHWLVVIDPIAGWIMTSFIVAGIAGLIRSPR